MPKPMSITAIAEIRQDELACRIFEAAYGVKREPGWDAERALVEMKKLDPVCHDGMKRAAVAAMAYVNECLVAARKTH